MRYNKKAFFSAVQRYKKALKPIAKKRSVCVISLQLENLVAFFSLAPLSRALHELGCDASVFVSSSGSESASLRVLKNALCAFQELKQGSKSQKALALKAFIDSVNKKTRSREFEKLFEMPELWLQAGKKGFAGTLGLPFEAGWFKRFKWQQLLETAEKILKQGYGIKKSESMSIGFELVPTQKNLQLPLQDYLDSFAIAYTFGLRAKRLAKKVRLAADSARYSQLEPMIRCNDLLATLNGCEYEKGIDEPWFKAFKKLSPFIEAQKLKPADASFSIHGKGYGGKHFFGLNIGYATPNKKSRWQGPGQMFLKPFWLKQTKLDSRPPRTRHAMTETLPIENFVATCNIDYLAMRKRDEKIRDILRKCKSLSVEGRRVKGGRTSLVLDLTAILKRRSPVLSSDIEVNPKTELEAAKVFKQKNGRYGNFPGGEVFITPHKMNGTFVGDVVIAIDQSYVIGSKSPLVVSIKDGHYRILSGPKHILKAFNKRKKEAWQLIKEFEKKKSMPKQITDSYKKNFDRVGEFAINTNPKARLSRYLIETEKLARMIHIALGSGYEPDRETLYHCDIVINNPRQKMDIFGITPKGEMLWIIKQGKFAV